MKTELLLSVKTFGRATVWTEIFIVQLCSDISCIQSVHSMVMSNLNAVNFLSHNRGKHLVKPFKGNVLLYSQMDLEKSFASVPVFML